MVKDEVAGKEVWVDNPVIEDGWGIALHSGTAQSGTCCGKSMAVKNWVKMDGRGKSLVSIHWFPSLKQDDLATPVEVSLCFLVPMSPGVYQGGTGQEQAGQVWPHSAPSSRATCGQMQPDVPMTILQQSQQIPQGWQQYGEGERMQSLHGLCSPPAGPTACPGHGRLQPFPSTAGSLWTSFFQKGSWWRFCHMKNNFPWVKIGPSTFIKQLLCLRNDSQHYFSRTFKLWRHNEYRCMFCAVSNCLILRSWSH